MIFVTVGTQLPFPRLIKALDEAASKNDLEIVAQTCDPYCVAPRLACVPHLDPESFDNHVRRAKMIVAHAGIGTILACDYTPEATVAGMLIYHRAASSRCSTSTTR